MARKRFNAAERELITRATRGDVRIQWRNVTQWHDASIPEGGGDIVTEDDGWQHVVVTNRESRGTVRSGETVLLSPGHIRERAA